MKYEKDWVRQESSSRRPDGLHNLSGCICRRQPCFDRTYTPSCEMSDLNNYAVLQFKDASLDDDFYVPTLVIMIVESRNLGTYC